MTANKYFHSKILLPSSSFLVSVSQCLLNDSYMFIMIETKL